MTTRPSPRGGAADRETPQTMMTHGPARNYRELVPRLQGRVLIGGNRPREDDDEGSSRSSKRDPGEVPIQAMTCWLIATPVAHQLAKCSQLLPDRL